MLELTLRPPALLPNPSVTIVSLTIWTPEVDHIGLERVAGLVKTPPPLGTRHEELITEFS